MYVNGSLRNRIGGRGLDWTVLAQDGDKWRAVVNAVMKYQAPKNAGNYITSSGIIKFSRRPLLRVLS